MKYHVSHLPVKHIHEFNQQNQHDNGFQHKRPRLMKLIDQETVKVFGGAQFFFSQPEKYGASRSNLFYM